MLSPEEDTDPNASDEAMLVGGFVWTAICALFSAVAVWRSWKAYDLYRKIGAFEMIKMRVHLLLVVYGLLDTIYGLSIAVRNK
jgi:uncharacterized membrane protein (DUF2068 family)